MTDNVATEEDSIEQALERIKQTIDSRKEILELSEIVQDSRQYIRKNFVKSTSSSEPSLLSDYVQNFTHRINSLIQSGHKLPDSDVHDIFREMLRPYLKSWLKHNLDSLAREILQEEVHKLFSRLTKT